jgi:4-hydroxy-4-methyl-2-oxoglutarate aldolase
MAALQESSVSIDGKGALWKFGKAATADRFERMNTIELADALGQFGTSTVYEAASKIGDMSPSIRPIVAGAKLAGVAVTIRIWPGDTLGVLRAIDKAAPGSVLVIDAGGTERAAVWGGTSSLACVVRGVRGCVTNGSVRDIDEINALKFPVFAAGISPRGTMKNHPGWHGLLLSVGDCPVVNGDIILGDSDGVLVVRAADAKQVLERAHQQDEKERERNDRVRSGESLASILGLPKA